MLVAQRDHVIEKLPAHGAHPPFGDSVLPRSADARSFGLKAGRLQERHDVPVELRIPVHDHVAVGTGVRKCFAQLLNHPLRARGKKGGRPKEATKKQDEEKH